MQVISHGHEHARYCKVHPNLGKHGVITQNAILKQIRPPRGEPTPVSITQVLTQVFSRYIFDAPPKRHIGPDKSERPDPNLSLFVSFFRIACPLGLCVCARVFAVPPARFTEEHSWEALVLESLSGGSRWLCFYIGSVALILPFFLSDRLTMHTTSKGQILRIRLYTR